MEYIMYKYVEILVVAHVFAIPESASLTNTHN
jgi:hypothetical protein